jgi:PAS domain-containing protein
MLIDNASNRFIKVNRAAADLFGYTAKSFQRMTPLDLSTETDEKEVIPGAKPVSPLSGPQGERTAGS